MLLREKLVVARNLSRVSAQRRAAQRTRGRMSKLAGMHDAEVEKHTNTAQSLPCRDPLLLQLLGLRRGKILAQSCGSVFEMGVCGACGHPGCFNGRSLAVEAAGLRLTHPRPQSTARLLADGLTYG